MHLKIDYDANLSAPTLAKALGAVAMAHDVTEPLIELLQKSGTQREPIPERYMQELTARFVEEGRRLDNQVFVNVLRWVDATIGAPLAKSRGARPRQLMLTQQQIDELLQLIRLHYRIAITGGIGGAWDIDPATERRWKVAKIIRPDVTISGMIKDAFVAGRLKQILDDGATIFEMRRMARELPMTRVQSLALQSLNDTVRYDLAGGIGYQMEQRAAGLALGENAERIAEITAQYRAGTLKSTPTNRDGLLPEEMAALADGHAVSGWRGLARELRNRMAGVDRDRDWERVAVSTLRLSHNLGNLGALEEQGTQFIYYHVHENACEHCKRLYLDHGKPRIFALSQVMADVRAGGGTNRGLKTAEWLPTALLHPWCQCRPFPAIKGVHY
jgi:hypothetical protein